MKRKYSLIILIHVLIFTASCQNDSKILILLKSHQKEEIIKGAYLAGESGNKIFSPLLLQNANDVRTSTSLKYKGYNIYQEKMIALSKIYKQRPPAQITSNPDSSVIKFYISLSDRKK